MRCLQHPKASTGQCSRTGCCSHKRDSPCCATVLNAATSSFNTIAGRPASPSVSYAFSIRRQPGIKVSSAPTPATAPSEDLWDSESSERYAQLLSRFQTADVNGNGVIDREELRNMLEGFDSGKQCSLQHWLTDDDVERVMRQYDTDQNGTLDFEEFQVLAQDGVLLEGKLEEYDAAFKSVDTNGNGRIGAQELAVLFNRLEQPMSYESLCRIFKEYDLDNNGQIDFLEFLRMFRGHLLDLKEIMNYIESVPAADPAPDTPMPVETAQQDNVIPGEINMISSEPELDTILKAHRQNLVVLMASLTWCRPCKGMQGPFQKIAQAYKDVTYLKFFGNESDNTKHLFKNRLGARVTPTFYFFQNGEIVHTHTGANKQRLEYFTRQFAKQYEDAPLIYPAYTVAPTDL